MQKEELQNALDASTKANEELKALLNELLNTAPTKVVYVVSGPTILDGKTVYRVNDDQVVGVAPLYGPIADIKEGTPVLLVANNIVGIMPDELFVVPPMEKIKLITWDQIGGLKGQVAQIREAVELPLKYAALAKDYGLKPINGILLHGGPGNGKTLIAQAIASTIIGTDEAEKDAFVYVKGADILSRYVGEAEKTVAAIFKGCRDYSKRTGTRSVFFIDEAEAILPARGSRKSSDVDTTIVPTFLAEMSGMNDGEHNPIIILATNKPEQLDAAILREGRMDLKIHIPSPDHESFREIVGIHLAGVKKHATCEDLAGHCSTIVFDTIPERASGAFASTVVNIATKNAMTRHISGNGGPVGIIHDDISNAIKQLSTAQ